MSLTSPAQGQSSRLIQADARALPLKAKSVQCVVTSIPYWGLRDYGLPPSVWGGDPTCAHSWGDDVVDRSRATPGTAESGLTNDGASAMAANRFEKRSQFCRCGAWRGCLGLEPTPELFVAHVVAVFQEVRRVLRDDGTVFLNVGDSYSSGGRTTRDPGKSKIHPAFEGEAFRLHPLRRAHGRGVAVSRRLRHSSLPSRSPGPFTRPSRPGDRFHAGEGGGGTMNNLRDGELLPLIGGPRDGQLCQFNAASFKGVGVPGVTFGQHAYMLDAEKRQWAYVGVWTRGAPSPQPEAK